MNKEQLVTSELFYNHIAGVYDDLLTERDKVVRKIVQDQFCNLMVEKYVLDFGGGTGLDLVWLSQSQAYTYFLEPCSAMREQAKKRSQKMADTIAILETDLDFMNWIEGHSFQHKIDGILANFAVLNCVSDLRLLFKAFSHITARGAYVIASVLKPGTKSGFGRWIFLHKKTPELAFSQYDSLKHQAYRHTLQDYTGAVKGCFTIRSLQPIPNSDFSLLILKRL